MSKDLNIAMQNAIGDLGTDVLKSPYLVNILQDYGAFDVHDKENVQKKEKIYKNAGHRRKWRPITRVGSGPFHQYALLPLRCGCHSPALRRNHRQLFGRVERRKEEKGNNAMMCNKHLIIKKKTH